MKFGSRVMTQDKQTEQFGPIYAILPTNRSKNQNFSKINKRVEDILISHQCNKNYDMFGCRVVPQNKQASHFVTI